MKVRIIPFVAVAVVVIAISVPETFAQRGRGTRPNAQAPATPAAGRPPQRSTFTYIPQHPVGQNRQSIRVYGMSPGQRRVIPPIIGYPYLNYPYVTPYGTVPLYVPTETVSVQPAADPLPYLPTQNQGQAPAPLFNPAGVATPANPMPSPFVHEVIVRPEPPRRAVPSALVVGMLRADVLQLLGTPKGTARWSTNETLFFDGGPQVALRDGRVTEIR